MMSTLIPRKAATLFCRSVDEHYSYAVNCSYPGSFRVLNKAQSDLMSLIDGKTDVRTIAERSNTPIAVTEQFLSLLSKTELIRFDEHFTVPVRPAKPDSLNFWVHTTDACNLGCSYCYISTLNTGKGMTTTIGKQLISKLAETAKNNDIRTIKLRLAGGEPLTQFNTWKTLMPEAKAQLAKVNCKLEVGFITNLTILNEEIINFCKEHDISFGVSLDGIDEVHDSTRQFRSGQGTFGIIDTNLQKLIAAGVPVSVNTVINNFNIVGLPELTRYLIHLNIPFRYSIVKGEIVHPVLLDQYLTTAYGIMEEAIHQGWQFSGLYQFCDLKPNAPNLQTCASGFSGGAIYTDGTFKYCHVNFGHDKGHSGSIFETEHDLLQMIEEGEHYEDERSDDCKVCKFRSVCTSGCPVYRIKSKDPQCSLYHRFIPMYYELQAKERLHLLKKYAGN